MKPSEKKLLEQYETQKFNLHRAQAELRAQLSLVWKNALVRQDRGDGLTGYLTDERLKENGSMDIFSLDVEHCAFFQCLAFFKSHHQAVIDYDKAAGLPFYHLDDIVERYEYVVNAFYEKLPDVDKSF